MSFCFSLFAINVIHYFVDKVYRNTYNLRNYGQNNLAGQLGHRDQRLFYKILPNAISHTIDQSKASIPRITTNEDDCRMQSFGKPVVGESQAEMIQPINIISVPL